MEIKTIKEYAKLNEAFAFYQNNISYRIQNITVYPEYTYLEGALLLTKEDVSALKKFSIIVISNKNEVIVETRIYSNPIECKCLIENYYLKVIGNQNYLCKDCSFAESRVNTWCVPVEENYELQSGIITPSYGLKTEPYHLTNYPKLILNKGAKKHE